MARDRMELSEAVEARTFEGRATSDLFEEVTVALGDISDGARIRWSGVIEGVTAAARDDAAGATAGSVLLAVVGSSDTALGNEQGETLQRVRAAAALALEPEPEPEHAQAQLAGSESPDGGMRQMLEFQAQRIVQLETEKRQLEEEVERLRRASLAQSPRPEEGVPPEQVTTSARATEDVGDGAALVARGQKQIAELKELLQRSLAQLDKNDSLPSRPAAAASTVP
eukprot:COSAG02_NODE_158_length_32954_cov_16.416771_16_plen_226_part_00